MPNLLTINDEILLKMLKEQLRDSIREEIKQEMLLMQKSPIEKPWKQVREVIEKRLFKTTMKRYDSYKIQSAIYLIIRFSLNINSVADLKEEQVEEAIQISNQIIDMITFPEIPIA